MYQMMSLPLYSGTLGEYNSWRDLGQELERLGCDGIEASGAERICQRICLPSLFLGTT